MNMHLFASIWNMFEQPLEAGVDATITALVAYVQGPFRAWVLVYLIGMLLIAAYSPAEDAFMAFFRHFFRAAFIYMLIAYAENFNHFVSAVALHGIPDGIVNALAAQANGQGFGPPAFDKLLVQSFQAGSNVFKTIPWLSFKGLALALFVVVYWTFAFLAIGFTFFVYLAAHAATALIVSVGPIFVAFRMFPATGSMFSGWLSALMSAVVLQILSVILLSLIVRAEGNQIASLAAVGTSPAGTLGDNIIDAVFILFGALLIFAAGFWLTYKLSSIAVTMAGGVYWGAESAISGRMGKLYEKLGGSDGSRPGAPSGATGGAGNAQASAYSFHRTVGAAP
jgi:type IV secretion system protein VirB6